jgi:hypothetical protein
MAGADGGELPLAPGPVRAADSRGMLDELLGTLAG